MKKLGVGIIGYGWAATAHIEAINATGLAEVKSVFSKRDLHSKDLSSIHGGEIKAYNRLEDILQDSSVDVVSITSHPWNHVDQAIAAAEAGKHIILEKPMALSHSDCLKLASVIRKTGVGFNLCFECRFSSQFQATRSIIDQGFLGEIHYGEIDYYHGIGPWYGQYQWNIKKEGGGSSLLSAGCHALDALLYCMGGNVQSVQSLSTKSSHPDFEAYEYDTTSVTILKFDDGRVGKTASVIDCLQPYYFHTHLVGSQGSLLDNKVHFHGVNGLNKNKWSEMSFGLVDSGDVSDHPYQNQFDCFFKSLLSGQPMNETGLDQALKTHEVIFASELSSQSGQPVELPLNN